MNELTSEYLAWDNTTQKLFWVEQFVYSEGIISGVTICGICYGLHTFTYFEVSLN